MHIFHPARADGGLDAAHVTLVTQFPHSPLPALQNRFMETARSPKCIPWSLVQKYTVVAGLWGVE
jgi:hypothetical protein